jgi:hypothetical protein
MNIDINDIFKHYIIAALWSTNDYSDESGGEPLDSNYSKNDISDETLEKLFKEVKEFIEINADLITESKQSAEQIGHDFWLTRNHHGAGFWDRNLGDIGDKLTKAAQAFKEIDIYVGDDGRLYSC